MAGFPPICCPMPIPRSGVLWITRRCRKLFFTAPPPKNFDLQEIEKIVIEQAVAHAGGNNQQAINLPGITREGLRNKLLRIGK